MDELDLRGYRLQPGNVIWLKPQYSFDTEIVCSITKIYTNPNSLRMHHTTKKQILACLFVEHNLSNPGHDSRMTGGTQITKPYDEIAERAIIIPCLKAWEVLFLTVSNSRDHGKKGVS